MSAVESGSNEKSISYDGNGNLSFYGVNTAGKNYVYDCENRMVKYYDTTSASYESADVTLYEYDTLGRRTGKSSATGGASESGALYEAYSYAGERVIADYNGDGEIRYRFIYGEGIDEVVCIMKTTVEGDPRYFGYFTDHLGSVVTLYRYNPLTGVKSIVDQYTYDAYGNVSIDDIDNWYNGNRYMFTGRRYDSESGLYYYRARMYNPELGIFQSQDPLGYIDSMNMYAYCANNPVNWVDPWGEKFYNKREVEAILTSGRNNIYNPLKHGYPSEIPQGYYNSNLDMYKKLNLIPGYDYGAGSNKCVDIYDVPKHGQMSATEFSNYVAGYLGSYHGSALGWLGMRAFGNMYENKNAIFWTGDDYESIRDINNGAYDGIKQRRSDVEHTLSLIGNILIANTPRRGFYE